MKKPLEQITIDDVELDLLVVAKRGKSRTRRVVAHATTDVATRRIVSMRLTPAKR